MMMMLALIVPAASAQTTVEFSTDNITFVNVTIQNEANRTAIQLALNPDTCYFFRAFNTTNTNTTFLTACTQGELQNVELTIGLIAFMAIFALIMILAQHLEVKLIAMMFLIGIAWTMHALLIQLASDRGMSANVLGILNASYKFMIFAYVIILSLIFIYLIYRLFIISMNIMKSKPGGVN